MFNRGTITEMTREQNQLQLKTSVDYRIANHVTFLFIEKWHGTVVRDMALQEMQWGSLASPELIWILDFSLRLSLASSREEVETNRSGGLTGQPVSLKQ